MTHTRDEMARELRQVSGCTLYFYDSLPLADHVLSLLSCQRAEFEARIVEAESRAQRAWAGRESQLAAKDDVILELQTALASSKGERA